jgi:hypothetical protein
LGKIKIKLNPGNLVLIAQKWFQIFSF